MEFKKIPQFTGMSRSLHPRALPDDKLYDCLNTVFKDGKTRSRWGYTQLGNQLSGTLLTLAEFTKLRTTDVDLIGITDNSTYKYNEGTGIWDQFFNEYNKGTINSQVGNELTVFSGVAEYGWRTLKLTETKVIEIRSGYSADNFIKARIIDASGTTITQGSEYSDATHKFSIWDGYVIDSTHVLVVYTNGTDNTFKAEVLTISGTIITFGTQATIYTGTGINRTVFLWGLSSTSFICGVALADTSILLFGGSISGTTVTTGGSNALNSVASITRGVYINSNTIFIIYQNLSNNNMYVVIYTIVGTSLNSGTPLSLGTSGGLVPWVCKLNDNTVFVNYTYNTGTAYNVFRTINIAGTVLSPNTIYDFGTNYTLRALTKVDETHIVFSYYDASYNNFLRQVILVNNLVTLNNPYSFIDQPQNAQTYLLEIFDTNKLFIIYSGVAIYENVCKLGHFDDTTFYLSSSYSIKTGTSVPNNSPPHGIKLNDRYFLCFTSTTSLNHTVKILDTHIQGNGTSWNWGWDPDNFQIKFGTNSINSGGNPNIWFNVGKFYDDNSLFAKQAGIVVQVSSTVYVFLIEYSATNTDYFDWCNIIEGLDEGDEKQIVFTNGKDPIKIFDGDLLTLLDMCGDIGVSPISLAKFCTYYDGHLIFGYCYDAPNWMPQTIYWSRRGFPTHWNSSLGNGAGYADLIQGDDYISGFEVFNQRLFIFKQQSIIEAHATGLVDPAFEFIEDKVRGIGNPYGRTRVNTGDMIIFDGGNNIYAFNGFQPTPIGNDIIDHIKQYENPDRKYRSFAIALKKEFLYCLFKVKIGSEFPNLIYVVNWQTGAWSIWQMAHNMNCAGTYLDEYAVFGDENGNVFLMDFSVYTDNEEIIPVMYTTKDYFDAESAIRVLQTMITAERNNGLFQIQCSMNYGNTWSAPVIVNQNTVNDVHEHVKHWMQRGERVRFKIQNISGSRIAHENLTIGYVPAGITMGR